MWKYSIKYQRSLYSTINAKYLYLLFLLLIAINNDVKHLLQQGYKYLLLSTNGNIENRKRKNVIKPQCFHLIEDLRIIIPSCYILLNYLWEALFCDILSRYTLRKTFWNIKCTRILLHKDPIILNVRYNHLRRNLHFYGNGNSKITIISNHYSIFSLFNDELWIDTCPHMYRYSFKNRETF